MASLCISPGDRNRLADAESVLFLVGGYDGSGNYGDVLQLATAIDTVARLPGTPLAVPIVERETHGHHSELMRRYGERFDAAVFAFFQDRPHDPRDGLEELPPAEVRTPRALLYLYGGGYMNGWWGGRKVAHTAAAEQLAGGRSLPVVASGLQVDEPTVAPGGPAHDLLRRASLIGVRDADSLELVRRQVSDATDRVELAGDDAMPFFFHPPVETSLIVNLHVNDGSWISDEPGSMRGKIVALVQELGRASAKPLELQPLIAYEDPRISERRIVSELLEQHGGSLEEAGLTALEPLDVLEDAIGNDLAAFRRGRLTVSCSYHVTLTSLLAGIPTVMLAQNDYYEQKASGLRDLFELSPTLVGVQGSAADAPAAIEALQDGPARSALLEHLKTQSEKLSARFDRGRAALSVALSEGLRRSASSRELEAARQRAESAELELQAMRATRGWQLLERLRAVRDRALGMMR